MPALDKLCALSFPAVTSSLNLFQWPIDAVTLFGTLTWVTIRSLLLFLFIRLYSRYILPCSLIRIHTGVDNYIDQPEVIDRFEGKRIYQIKNIYMFRQKEVYNVLCIVFEQPYRF